MKIYIQNGLCALLLEFVSGGGGRGGGGEGGGQGGGCGGGDGGERGEGG